MDRLAAFVRQQRERDFLGIAKLLENIDCVIADADDLHVGGAEPFRLVTQLDQLLATKRSPISRAVEYERDVVRREDTCQRLRLTMLV